MVSMLAVSAAGAQVVTVRFTSPGLMPDSLVAAGACRNTSGLPIADWRPSVTVLEAWSDAMPTRVTLEHETVPAGQADSFTYVPPWGSTPGTACVKVRRWNGLEPCERTCVATGDPLPAAVPHETYRAATRWYDVAGRNIPRPWRSGVWFVISTDSLGRALASRKVVIVR